MWRSEFPPYVSVAERRAKAKRHALKLTKKGQKLIPIEIAGRRISTSFWGQAWCNHIESYSDFENRLPRGRTYVRNGSILDLQIEKGKVAALVSGSSVYSVDIGIRPATKARWAAITSACSGKIDSLIELLSGKLSDSVMKIVTDRSGGLFPAPSEITMKCSCPDWAKMCKHVAAVLYGIGARFDSQPELLFELRGVNHSDLLSRLAIPTGAPARGQLEESNLGEIFDIEISDPVADRPPASKAKVRGTRLKKSRSKSRKRSPKTSRKGGKSEQPPQRKRQQNRPKPPSRRRANSAA